MHTDIYTIHFPLCSSVFIRVHLCASVVAICGSIGVHPCLSVSIRFYLSASVVAICGSTGVHPCLSVFISGCNLWFQWCPSVFIRVHQWLQSVVPTVSIRVYPCSSVVAICGCNLRTLEEARHLSITFTFLEIAI